MINSNLIDDFLDYMKSTKGASDNTVKEYYYDLRMFVRFIKRRKGLVDSKVDFGDITIEDISPELLESVTKQDVYAYNAFLERERKISNRSKFRKISSIRSFYNYLHAKIDITLDQSLNLLRTIEESKSKPLYKKRDYAIVTLFLNCGMRLSELAGINISHLQEDNTLKVIGKGNKERVIYLNEASIYAIEEYLKVRPQIKDDALFLSMRQQRMSNRSIQHMIEKHMRNSGLDTKKYSVHKLRHTAATLLYEYGNADIRSLQEILGHESVNTTEIYTHVNKEALRKMVASNPLSNLDLKTNASKDNEEKNQ